MVSGLPGEVEAALRARGAMEVDWRSQARNAQSSLGALERVVGSLPALARDLVGVAAAVYLADLAILRGRNEDFVRQLELHVPVRELSFWRQAQAEVAQLLYLLTGDNLAIHFYPAAFAEEERAAGHGGAGDNNYDCVALLSGGLDSLAAAVMLLRTGRRPLFISHRSGNPTVTRAQGAVVRALRRLGAAFGHAAVVLMPRSAPGALPFPPPEAREPTRRARSLLFLALGTAAAMGVGSAEVYLGENGVLTAALPLAPSRAGALSTRSTHPAVLKLWNNLCAGAGLRVEVINPFLYQTKAELIRGLLRPVLRAEEIQQTVSCWGTGRRHRQCGGCVPCLLRRLAMLAAGLPDEAYELDLLGRPEEYRGTDAYVNLVDLLGYVAHLADCSREQLVLEAPGLLDLGAHGVSVPDIVAMLKRFAAEVTAVVEKHFPAAARLLASSAAGRSAQRPAG
jgi:7-cyano-7-deazaguanine synthase in queuosine biosynthesis